ncbi:MAG: hypothetical protein Kow0075_07650 [Salibacteraceae bacterium]
MFIANKYKETNIVEYVLYMWHIEELIRSFNFSIEEIDKHVIQSFGLDADKKEQLRNWYSDLIKKMTEQGIRNEGHLLELKEIMNEIQYLHHSLLTVFQDKDYQRLVAEAMPGIEALKSKSDGRPQTDIEVAMNGLFGVLVLKLKKKQVSASTQEAVKAISAMMAALAGFYKKMKSGSLSFPRVMEN